uniref:Alternative protein C20orf196 n=1 Tax=Homo sapiens TaxID=9606 RepID=L8EBE3_HUMAN|nr:alternative protein C20orf196 [Homo sapiens]
MMAFGNPWIDSMKCLVIHSQALQTHSLHLSASACLRKSLN